MICSIKELRQKTSEIIELVESGEEVIITSRGVKKARLLPLEVKANSKAKDAAFGMWKDRDDMEDSAAYVRELRKGRTHAR